MKKYIFGLITTLSMFVFFLGIKPTCLTTLYQPDLPDELK